jgi:preprotein translocase subunit YajC
MNQSTITIIYFVVLIGVFYFLIIRPQQTRQREAAALIASLTVGDRVITAGGLYGTIRRIEGDAIDLEIADGVVATFARSSVAKRIED